MPGSNNFVQWNPSSSNQESDAAYAADSQRSGGAPDGSTFPAITANKLFYQLSTGITALMQMMALKGYDVNDANLATLTSVLSAIQTAADKVANVQSVPYSSAITLDASKYNGLEMLLSGNTYITVTGQIPGQKITFQFVQDGTGNRTVTWGSNFFGGLQPDPSAGYGSVISFTVGGDLTLRVSTPPMGVHGLFSSPIGIVNPASGGFTTLSSSSLATLNSLTVNGNVFLNGLVAVTSTIPQSDNSTGPATTAWSKFGFTFVFSSPNGYIKFPTWLGGFMVQWGTVSSPANVTNTGSFPYAFTNRALGVVGNCAQATGTGGGFSIWLTGGSNFAWYSSNILSTANYIAVGY
jgi:hypothetical protein